MHLVPADSPDVLENTPEPDAVGEARSVVPDHLERLEASLGSDGLVHDPDVINMDICRRLFLDVVPKAMNSSRKGPRLEKTERPFVIGSETMNTPKTNVFPLTLSTSEAIEPVVDSSTDSEPTSGTLNHQVKFVDHAVHSKIQAFWRWFVSNEAKLRAVKLDSHGAADEDSMAAIVELCDACGQIDEDLSVELENEDKAGVRRLIISGNGISDVFPVVEAIVASAPALTHWSVVKYRQRQSTFHALSLKGHTIRPSDVRFGVMHHKGTGEFGIYIFLSGYSAADREVWQHIGFIFLDLALGEFDVATKVRCIEFENDRALPQVHRLTLEELPAVFDHLFTKSRH